MYLYFNTIVPRWDCPVISQKTLQILLYNDPKVCLQTLIPGFFPLLVYLFCCNGSSGV